MKLALGSVLAGLAIFLYSFLSFGVLTWHHPRTLKDDGPLAAAIKASVTDAGVYAVPSMRKPDGAHRNDDEWFRASQAGPYMFAVLRPGASQRPMLSFFAAGIVYNIAVSFLLGLILVTARLGRAGTITLSVMIGLFASLSNWLPAYNWYEYPPSHWLPYVVDSVIQGALAGAILGKFIGRRPQDGP